MSLFSGIAGKMETGLDPKHNYDCCCTGSFKLDTSLTVDGRVLLKVQRLKCINTWPNLPNSFQKEDQFMLNLVYRFFSKFSFFYTIRLTESRTTIPVNSPLIL